LTDEIPQCLTNFIIKFRGHEIINYSHNRVKASEYNRAAFEKKDFTLFGKILYTKIKHDYAGKNRYT